MVIINSYSRISLLSGIHVSPQQIENILSIDNSPISIESICSNLKLSKNNEQIRLAFNNLNAERRRDLLESWLYLLQQRTEHDYNVELCVTGINSEKFKNSNISETYQTFLDLIKSAKMRIIIIGYIITNGEKILIERLERRLEDGVHLHIVTNNLLPLIEQNLYSFYHKWLNIPNYNLSLWNYQSENSLMHIKCMLIDSNVVYVGSSNFTKGGMTRNIELGLVLRERTIIENIERIYSYLTSLKYNSDIQRVTYTSLMQNKDIGAG